MRRRRKRRRRRRRRGRKRISNWTITPVNRSGSSQDEVQFSSSQGGHERQFSRDAFSAEGSCEQFWHRQESPLFYVVHPAFLLPTKVPWRMFWRSCRGVWHARTVQVSVSLQFQGTKRRRKGGKRWRNGKKKRKKQKHFGVWATTLMFSSEKWYD